MHSIFKVLPLVSTLAFAACAAPPSAEVQTGVSSIDDRIKYTIKQYEEPYDILGISATHVLTSNIVQVGSSSDTNYYGLPDGVSFELLGAADIACGKLRKDMIAVQEDGNAQLHRLDLYFTCG